MKSPTRYEAALTEIASLLADGIIDETDAAHMRDDAEWDASRFTPEQLRAGLTVPVTA